MRSVVCRIAESTKATLEFDDAAAIKFLMHPLFSDCTNWPILEKRKGKKRAAGVSAALVATAVKLGDEKVAHPSEAAQISL